MITAETVAAAPKDAPVAEGLARSSAWLTSGTWFCRCPADLSIPAAGAKSDLDEWIAEVLARPRVQLAEHPTHSRCSYFPGLRIYLTKTDRILVQEAHAKLLDGYELFYIESDGILIGVHDDQVVVGVQRVEIVMARPPQPRGPLN